MTRWARGLWWFALLLPTLAVWAYQHTWPEWAPMFCCQWSGRIFQPIPFREQEGFWAWAAWLWGSATLILAAYRRKAPSMAALGCGFLLSGLLLLMAWWGIAILGHNQIGDWTKMQRFLESSEYRDLEMQYIAWTGPIFLLLWLFGCRFWIREGVEAALALQARLLRGAGITASLLLIAGFVAARCFNSCGVLECPPDLAWIAAFPAALTTFLISWA